MFIAGKDFYYFLRLELEEKFYDSYDLLENIISMLCMKNFVAGIREC